MNNNRLPYYKLLVVGCGRSGTTYFATFLRAMGVRVRHERLGADGSVGWNAVFTFLPEAFHHRWLLVRHPLDVIASVASYPGCATKQKCLEFPADPTLRALEYWVRWNTLCDSVAEHVVRVEDIRPGSETVAWIREQLGVPKRRPTPNISQMNGRPHPNITWETLNATDAALSGRARALATRYGYVA